MAYKDSVYFKRPWLKSHEPGVPATINYEEITMPDILDRTAGKYPEKAALVFQGYSITYRQMKDMVDRFATCLTDFGVKQGDAVAILLPNMIPQVIAYYATLRIGAITVLNNPLYSDRELEHQFNDSGSRVLVTLDLLGNRMIDLRPKTKVKQIVYTSIGDYLLFPKNLLFPLVAKKKKMAADVKAAPDVYKWKDCIAKYSLSPPRPDFELRVVPSSIIAQPGACVPITVYALRREGFDEDILLQLVEAPPGSNWFPAYLRCV